MGVRPPQQDDDEPSTIEFGIAALAARLDDSELVYPLAGEELVEELGDPEIPIDANGRRVPLSRVLGEVSQRRFDSQQELLNALHPVFESYRDRTSTGILASIRAMLPF
ncbi:MAG: hypothetical protein ABEI39_02100 [Halobacteriales archaeon]